MRIQLMLDDVDDADLIRWWGGLAKGKRTQALRAILRWYVVPGGFRDLLAHLGPVTPLAPPQPPQETGDVLQRAMAAFGWENED